MSRIVYDGTPIDFESGDSAAMAAVRAGQHPARGGTLCLAGDCGNCVAIVDGTPWIKTCQTMARPGMVVVRHPDGSHPSPALSEHHAAVTVRHRAADHIVVGAGDSGIEAAQVQRDAGHDVLVLEAANGDEP